MSFKTILVNLNDEARVPVVIAAAALLARKSDAHLIGLYVLPPLLLPGNAVMPMSEEFTEEQIAEHRAQMERIKAIFEEQTRGEPFVAEWRARGNVMVTYEPVADGVIKEAHAAEIVIASQAIGAPLLSDIPERVALESGRPVLVIPSAWQPGAYGNDVAVAWNDSREAARATFDALPFLKAARKVRLMTVGERMRNDKRDNTLPAAEVAATLARHGFNVEVETIAGGGRAGEAILSRVAADGADLLVMGAYGHSRMREFVLGGATRDVLRNMTVPVLMSH